MEGHVRSSTGRPGQTDYQERTEYLTGPGDGPRPRRARAGSTGDTKGKRGLAIAATALVAVLAGGGVLFAVVNDTTDTGGAPASGPAPASAPAAENDQPPPDDAAPARGESAGDRDESAGDPDGAGGVDGPPDTVSGGVDETPADTSTASRTKPKKQKDDAPRERRNPAPAEEEVPDYWPADGPEGSIPGQGPSN